MRTRGLGLIIALLGIALLRPAGALSTEADAAWRQRLPAAAADIVADDIQEEISFGREVAARLAGRYTIYDNERVTRYVNLVGKAIALNTNRPELEFHFGVLNTDEINAYAAPGGFVFVTRGAIMRMQDESELAGVLAHEVGHIVERHVVNELHIRGTEGSATAGLARLIGGSSESARIAFYQSVDQALDMLFKTGYHREDEVQSDRDAMLFCTLSGYDPAGLVRYFERLNTLKGKNTEVLDKTHPSYEVRIAWLKGIIADEGMENGASKTFKDRFIDMQRMLK